MNQHGKVEDSKNDVDLVHNGLEGRWYERTKSGVESPVGGRCQSDSLTTDTKWVELGRVH